jgi:NADH:ubiquinone oxidoreductase subunit K
MVGMLLFLLILPVIAAETAIGLAICINMYKLKNSISLDLKELIKN